MGFFSWNCKVCGHPMLSPYVIDKINGWMNDVVVVEKSGRRLRGEYDGYGRVDGSDIRVEWSDQDTEKDPADCYHRRCYELAGEPREYTGGSQMANDQGYFFNEKDHAVKEPKTLKAAQSARRKAALAELNGFLAEQMMWPFYENPERMVDPKTLAAAYFVKLRSGVVSGRMQENWNMLTEKQQERVEKKVTRQFLGFAVRMLARQKVTEV